MSIDVWDPATYAPALASLLDTERPLIADYFTTGRRMWLEREAQTLRGPMLANPHGDAFYEMLEQLMGEMRTRTIRAWHHTRMCDDEVALALQTGLRPTSLEALRARLNHRVATGDFSRDQADALFAASRLHGEQAESRGGKFYMCSHPHPIDEDGIEELLLRWGGEVAYFDQHDPALCELLLTTGRARVIEVAVPLAATDHAFDAAKAVVAATAKAMEIRADWGGFDVYAVRPLPPEAVLRIHTEDEADFARLARGYPAGFSDSYGD